MEGSRFTEISRREWPVFRNGWISRCLRDEKLEDVSSICATVRTSARGRSDSGSTSMAEVERSKEVSLCKPEQELKCSDDDQDEDRR